jgi:hypothetical protein
MNIKKTLVVFDFDGTLFKSPYKPEGWKGAWWSNIKSLTPPLMPQHPGNEWWNDEICEEAFVSLADPAAYTIMLTGRIDKVFNERVNELLEQKGFNFPYVGLAKLHTSIDSKFQHLDKILSDNPYFEKIIFYDDRTEHFPLFEEYCNKKELECEVIPVKEAYTMLEGKQTNKNKVYVLIGPPGVGKSTYIRNNSALRDATIISRDNIVERVAEENGYTYTQMFGNTPELKELNKQINNQLAISIDSASKSEKDVVVDMTNMNVSSRANILNKFPKNKFIRIALDFMPDESNFDNLMKSNDFRNSELKNKGKDKDISRNVLRSMFDRYEPPTEEEGFDRVTDIDVDARLSNM